MIRKKRANKTLVSLLAMIIAVVIGIGTFGGVVAFGGTFGGANYYTDFDSMDEAKKAAEELTKEIASEGDVLLKNKDNALPMSGKEWVSVFGVKSDNLIGASDSSGAHNNESSSSDSTVADALSKAGFHVNPTLKAFYDNDSSGIGNEDVAFNGKVKSSFDIYNDAAVILLSREGGEGSDASRTKAANGNVEKVGDDDDHLALLSDADGTYKHSLMLTNSEQALIKLVTAKFRKVIVVLNTSNVMEVEELNSNDAISAIINIGRPGVGGLNGLAEILNGKVNPSGGLVDEWMSDLTTDPTWYNVGDNSQTKGYGAAGKEGAGSNYYLHADGTKTGSKDTSTAYDSEGYHGVDYEESIYLGYKYYETYYYDMYNNAEDQAGRDAAQQWWKDNVLYPFGYGLSYTTFSFNVNGLYTDKACTTALGDTVSAAKFNSSYNSSTGAKTKAQVEKLYVPVEVKNTGSVAGKKVVQIYVTAPYTIGGIEKSAVTLVGFAKTDILKPGKTQTVIVEFNVQDMASWDYNNANEASGDTYKGDYELDKGEYIVRAMENSHFDCATDVSDKEDAYDEIKFNLTETANLQLDDFSHNALKNLFSADNGTYDSLTENHDLAYNNIRTASLMADDASAMTLLSRSDMDATFPKAPTVSDLTFKDNVLKNWAYWDNFRVSDNVEIDSATGLPTDKKTWDASYDKDTDPWYKSAEQIPENWKQATGTYDPKHKVQNNRTELEFGMYVSSADESPIKYSEMATVPYESEKWDDFLNQLTYDELCTVVEFGGYSTVDIASVGKIKTLDTDGPNNLDGTHCWCSADVIAATWNVELAEKQGKMVGNIGLLHGVNGWYGPGMDIHRSPFSGRNNEYYSQDGLQGGYMCAAVINGAQSKGIICYVKHCFMNDQESNRGNLFTWASEQTIRETYAKGFQMALQEGGSQAAMTGYGRLGGLSNTGNYNLGTELYVNQWGTNAYFVTDGYIGWRNRTDPDIMVRTGNQLELYTTPFVEYLSGEWDAAKGTVIVGAKGESIESPTQWYCVRTAAKSILYQIAKTSGQQNGYANLKIAGGTLSTGVQGISYTASVSISNLLNAGSSASYAVSGNFPEGLTLNPVTGAISGKTSNPGVYNFTVTSTIDGWIVKTANYSIKIDSAFSFDADGDAIDGAKVGEEFMTRITSTTYTPDKYNSIKYSVKSGAMPDGIVLSEDGTISGTPTTAGTYTVVVKMTAEETSTGGGSKGTKGSKGDSEPTVVTTDFSVTFVVTGGEAPVAPDYATKDDVKDAVEDAMSDMQKKIDELTKKIDELNKTEKTGCSSDLSGVGSIAIIGVLTLMGGLLLIGKKRCNKDK